MKTRAAVAMSLAALLLPAPAAAHLVLHFDPQTARPGDVVNVDFPDAHNVFVDVFLVPLESAREFDPPPTRPPVALVPMGTLGPGGLSFVVPDLPVGRYTTVLRRQDGRYLASTQPQLPAGVDPTGVELAPDPAVLRIVGAQSRPAVFLLFFFGVLLLGAVLVAGLVIHRRWHDTIS